MAGKYVINVGCGNYPLHVVKSYMASVEKECLAKLFNEGDKLLFVPVVGSYKVEITKIE